MKNIQIFDVDNLLIFTTLPLEKSKITLKPGATVTGNRRVYFHTKAGELLPEYTNNFAKDIRFELKNAEVFYEI